MSERGRWYGRIGYKDCPVCRRPFGPFDRRASRHHVLRAQIVRREGGQLYDVRNRMVICHRCHEAHTNRVSVIPAYLLPDDAITYAVELLGAGKAYNALLREYAGTDVRLQALLATE